TVRSRICINVMVGVPEESVVVGGLVAVGVVNVNVDDVRSQLAHVAKPARIAAAQVLTSKAGDRVVLVVVVRHQGCRACLENCFMAALNCSKRAPAVLVDDLPLVLERVVPFDG